MHCINPFGLDQFFIRGSLLYVGVARISLIRVIFVQVTLVDVSSIRIVFVQLSLVSSICRTKGYMLKVAYCRISQNVISKIYHVKLIFKVRPCFLVQIIATFLHNIHSLALIDPINLSGVHNCSRIAFALYYSLAYLLTTFLVTS